MSKIGIVRKLVDDDFDDYIEIFHGAYPVFAQPMSKEKREQLIESLKNKNNTYPEENYYGYFRDDKLHGTMIFYDFKMRIFSTITTVGGLGDVSVDLLTKKEHIAKEMMEYFHNHYRERKIPLTLLYPFRPDFYAKMGYGFGKKMNQYSFEAINLPVTEKKTLRFLDSNDIKAVAECFNRVAVKVHGMILRPEYKFKDMFNNLKVVGYEENNRILGFIGFRFRQLDKYNMIRNNILIREFVYENRAAFRALVSFLRTQHDQINRIIYNTPDDHFHHILFDPRSKGNESLFHISQETNIQGVGMMYRVIDTPRMFEVLEGHNFGHQSVRLKITIDDTFLSQNAGNTIIHFEDGKGTIVDSGEYETEIKLKIADFSSLIMGVISFRKLFRYNLAEISNPEYLEVINNLFLTEEGPITTEPF
ncbi:MAG: enhanced intracellular survival protein Eis [Candidatus Hodarchaeota archaeon]